MRYWLFAFGRQNKRWSVVGGGSGGGGWNTVVVGTQAYVMCICVEKTFKFPIRILELHVLAHT